MTAKNTNPLVSFHEYSPTKPDSARKLADAVQSTTDLADNSLAPNTKRGYERDWAHFEAWCTEMRESAPAIEALPASDKTLAIYLGAHKDDTPSTMQRRFAAIRHVHVRLGHESPFDKAPVFSIVLKGYKRSWANHKPTPQRAATDNVIADMLPLIDTNTLLGLRNKAMLLFTYDGAFRRSETVSVDIEDLEFLEDGILVHLGSSKTNSLGEHSDSVAILARPDSEHCPVAALNTWIQAAEITSGPLFLQVRRKGGAHQCTNQRLSDKALYRLVKQLAKDAGYEGKFGAHSLRHGAVSSALQRGEEITALQRHVRHKNLNTTSIYSEARDKFAEHPSRSLRTTKELSNRSNES